MAVNTSGSISTYLSNIFEAALLAAREQSIMPKLVSVFGDAQGMAGRAFSTYAGGTFGTIAESTDLTAQGFTPSSSGTLTPYVYAAAYQLSDMRVASDPFGVTADAGRDLGQLYAVGVDTGLCGTAIFSNLTAGTCGATVTALAWGTCIQKASAKIRIQKAPAPYACVLAPAQWYDLSAATSIPALLQSQRLMDEFGQFYTATWAGINFFVDANITDTNGTVIGGMFNPQAIALDIRRGFRIEPQRDASVGGGVTELNASAVYAFGLYRAAFGAALSGASF
jgi:hypothetical protein